MTDRLVVRANSGKTLGGAFICLLVAGFFFLPILHAEEGNIISPIFFGAFVLLFLLAAGVNLVKQTDSRPLLVIDERGIFDNDTVHPAVFIPWEEVVDMRRLPLGENHQLAIFIRDPDALIASAEGAAAWIMRQTYKNIGTPVTVSELLTGKHADDIISFAVTHGFWAPPA